MRIDLHGKTVKLLGHSVGSAFYLTDLISPAREVRTIVAWKTESGLRAGFSVHAINLTPIGPGAAVLEQIAPTRDPRDPHAIMVRAWVVRFTDPKQRCTILIASVQGETLHEHSILWYRPNYHSSWTFTEHQGTFWARSWSGEFVFVSINGRKGWAPRRQFRFGLWIRVRSPQAAPALGLSGKLPG